MRYYYEYIKYYLPRLHFKYNAGDDCLKKEIENEVLANKNLRKFQKEYIIRVIKGEEKLPHVSTKYKNRK